MERSHCSKILTRKSGEQSEREKYKFLITLIRILKTVSTKYIFDWETTTDWHLGGNHWGIFYKIMILKWIIFVPKMICFVFHYQISYPFPDVWPVYPVGLGLIVENIHRWRGESTLLSQRKYNDIIKDTYCTLSR